MLLGPAGDMGVWGRAAPREVMAGLRLLSVGD